jgi:hypothetical protein
MGYVGRSPKEKVSQPVVPKQPTTTRQNVEWRIAPSEGAPSLKRQRTEQQDIDQSEGILQRPTSEINGQLQHQKDNPDMDEGKEPEKPLKHEEKETVIPAQKR